MTHEHIAGSAVSRGVDLELLARLAQPAESRIVLWVLDGLGGLPVEAGGPTELEAARTPHLDRLAAEGIAGLIEPVGPGITPGSGPGHLALFGYDPLKYEVGRGVLSALGIGVDLQAGDVAARGNFCTVDEAGHVVDRRAGRIDSDVGRRLCEKLAEIELPGVQLDVRPVKEYRFVLRLRGEGLSGAVGDTDPQATGVPPSRAEALEAAAERTADLVRTFLGRAAELLQDDDPANMALLRGFSTLPDWPRFPDVTGLRAAALADYPMYRGVARLLGMEVLESEAGTEARIDAAERHWADHDYFFLHEKPIDAAGEDGDFDRRVDLIERIDAAVPRLLALEPDVLVVTGDHSTPARLKAHSWHPVPVLLHAASARPDAVERFSERACIAGALGPRLPAPALLPLALGHAGRLRKFGA
ncbi:MAG: 2,3-bisphosphoglycerate-independent phosphoglycerate mutase [Trueperaceae bacterium]